MRTWAHDCICALKVWDTFHRSVRVEGAIAFRLFQNVFLTEEGNLKIETSFYILYMYIHVLLNNPCRGLLNSTRAQVLQVVLYMHHLYLQTSSIDTFWVYFFLCRSSHVVMGIYVNDKLMFL